MINVINSSIKNLSYGFIKEQKPIQLKINLINPYTACFKKLKYQGKEKC